MSYAKSTHSENTFPQYIPCQQLKFIFHSRDTPFDLVFHDRVAPVSVSTLKPLLGVIGAIPLNLRVSSIVGTHIKD